MKTFGIVWESTTPSTELPSDFCAEIGPLQLGVVLVFFILTDSTGIFRVCFFRVNIACISFVRSLSVI